MNRMRWAEHVACRRYAQNIGLRLRVPKERDRLEHIDVHSRIILKEVFKKRDVNVCTEFIWFSIGASVGICKCCNEPSSAIQCEEFLDQL
jgi:hypothetical protein